MWCRFGILVTILLCNVLHETPRKTKIKSATKYDFIPFMLPTTHLSRIVKQSPHGYIDLLQHLLDLAKHKVMFLAATAQLYEWFSPSVRLSVCLSHAFRYVPIIVSSIHFLQWLPMTDVMSMQKVKVRGQRSRSRRKNLKLAISGP